MRRTWERLQEAIVAAVPDAFLCVVGEEGSGASSSSDEVTLEALQGNYSRSHALSEHKSTARAKEVDRQKVMSELETALRILAASAAKALESAVQPPQQSPQQSPHSSSTMELKLVAFEELWVHAGSFARVVTVRGVQLEGFAPAALRQVVTAALDLKWLPASALVTLNGVLWYGSAAQGLLHERRRKAHADARPLVQLKKEGALHTQYISTRDDQRDWLAAFEAFCEACAPCDLGALLRRSEEAKQIHGKDQVAKPFGPPVDSSRVVSGREDDEDDEDDGPLLEDEDGELLKLEENNAEEEEEQEELLLEDNEEEAPRDGGGDDVAADDDGLLLEENEPPQPQPQQQKKQPHDWRAGKRRLARSPPIEYYPSFVSDEEIVALLGLGAAYAKPKPGGGAVVLLPPDVAAADRLVQEIEARCAEATGIHAHHDEAPLMMMHTTPTIARGSGGPLVHQLHLDTNHDKHYRCATVLIYLNDVPRGHGGGTVFPMAGAAEDDPLLAIGEGLLNVHGFHEIERHDAGGPDAPSELRRLFHAAEQGDVGVRIRPRRGSACVFWTRHPGEPPGDIDPRTWHGAEKLVEGAGGKMIAQKFKEVPLEQRGDY